jgi:hypothetical protein
MNLLSGHTVEITLTVERVYDYFCTPHEIAGMVGRIIGARDAGRCPSTISRTILASVFGSRCPSLHKRRFPAIDDILAKGVIAAGMERLLRATIEAAVAAGAVKPASLARVTVDTTVQPKAIAQKA